MIRRNLTKGTMVIFLLFCNSNIFSGEVAEKGLYNILNFSPADYENQPQNFAILQDRRGVMYFGNNGGLLEYDGIAWRLIETPDNARVRSLAMDPSGKIFVGAVNDFGYLNPDASGNLKYKSLIQNVISENLYFGDVWKTCASPDGIYFQTYNYIFRWDGKELKTWKTDTQFHTSFLVNNHYFVREKDYGLRVMINDSLTTVNTGELFKITGIYEMFPYKNDQFMIITNNKRIFALSDPFIPEKTRLRQIMKDFTRTIQGSEIINAVEIGPYQWAFGTWGSGIIVYNQQINSIEILNKDAGLQDDIVNSLFIDNRGMLWASLSKGISMIPIQSPITFYNSKNGLESTIEDITRYRGHLIAATHLGSFYLSFRPGLYTPADNLSFPAIEKMKFFQFPKIVDECWGLLPYSNNKESLLLILQNKSIREVDKNSRISNILETVPWDILQSKILANTVFIASENGLETITRKNRKWTTGGNILHIKDRLYKLTEDHTGNLWMGTFEGQVIKMNEHDFSQKGAGVAVTYYDSTNGLPDGEMYVQSVNGKLLVGTAVGIYTFSPGDNAFIPDISFGREFTDGTRFIHRISPDAAGNIWVVTVKKELKKGNYETGYFKPVNKNQYQWVSKPFVSFSKKGIIHAIYHDTSGITWLGGPSGLYRYDSHILKNYEMDFNTLIRRIILGRDSVYFNGANFDEHHHVSLEQPDILRPELKYSLNSLTFEFAAQNNEDGAPVLFSYRLEGFEQSWSDWSEETKKEYTNLHERSYTFHVKAKNIYGQEGKEATFGFVILPPWERTIPAYFAYLILLSGLIYSVVTVYTRNLRKIIRERTAEIRMQKEEIEAKNKDIMDSIKYAERIQTALLPPGDYIQELFPERFILFLPRDIVSGDFFWIMKKEERIITVAADCTGHGVPGAFMSMLGMAFLNEITNVGTISHASEILDQLRSLVVSSLRQTGNEGESRDGMDIALHIFNQKTMQIEFAGANNPLILIRDNELTVIKPDRMPIGISRKMDQPFTNHILDVQKGDLLYIFSDGFQDQFGGPDNKKFMIKNFKSLLLEIHHRSMDEQKEALLHTIMNWMDDQPQVDDILVLGIKV
ncbi:MAG: SpoIIE family protein phosphatase [Chlorobi bacterium]|nr:SpoIIE family protein phosphatase [Chlorobiota bacterium]